MTTVPRSGAATVDQDGAIHVPAHELPLSQALSPESRELMARALSMAPPTAIPRASDFADEDSFRAMVDMFRKGVDERYATPRAQSLLEVMPVAVRATTIGGIPIEEFTPHEGAHKDAVLINLHGGGFFSGAIHVGRIESVPLAYLGGYRVISVDYRQGYEHKFPAATEDVVAAYTALLEDYAPERIGIYGGSAGGVLTAQATAWFIDKGLPVPGAIGIFGAGTGGSGDSNYFAAIGTGLAPPMAAMSNLADGSVGYFADAFDDDYLVNPILAPEHFRAHFPPALFITGTRSFDLSPAIATHRALVQAGVDASLHVFDGLAHCFYYDAHTPEGADAYQTILRFFAKHLRPEQ